MLMQHLLVHMDGPQQHFNVLLIGLVQNGNSVHCISKDPNLPYQAANNQLIIH